MHVLGDGVATKLQSHGVGTMNRLDEQMTPAPRETKLQPSRTNGQGQHVGQQQAQQDATIT